MSERKDGRFELSRDFIREGIRHIAEDYCTRQLGLRSERDTAESQRREVQQYHYTSLDRIIQRDAGNAVSTEPTFFTVTKDPSRAGFGPSVSLTERRTAERLMFLASMGLAESAGPKTWRVRRDFENILRAMQRRVDLQKTLAAHGVLMSDNRLPINVLEPRDLTTSEGRILVHGEEESSGRNYLLLEGTDELVHYIYYTPEMETARNVGGLRTNAFIRLRRLFTDGRPVLKVDEFGDAESVLHNRPYLRETAQRLIRRGIVPQNHGWDGWLGRYQKVLAEAASALERQRATKTVERHRNRDLGR